MGRQDKWANSILPDLIDRIKRGQLRIGVEGVPPDFDKTSKDRTDARDIINKALEPFRVSKMIYGTFYVTIHIEMPSVVDINGKGEMYEVYNQLTEKNNKPSCCIVI